jgi:Tfp pilus assembly protein PilV
MKGFTLVEVIIALAFLLVTMTIFGLVISSLPLIKTARNQNLAYHLAAKKIEELRNTSYASLPASGSYNDAALAELPSGSANLTVASYQSSAKIKDAVVTISWSDASGSHSVSLETLIGSIGLGKP